MTSINLYKSYLWEFFAISHRFPDILYLNFEKFCDIENIGQDNDVQHLIWRHSMASVILYKRFNWVKYYRFLDFVYLYNSRTKFDLENIGQVQDALQSQWRDSKENTWPSIWFAKTRKIQKIDLEMKFSFKEQKNSNCASWLEMSSPYMCFVSEF